MIQLIETSLISAHFADASWAIYLDVFSCAPYDLWMWPGFRMYTLKPPITT
jgi:hypothetical protein